MALEQDYRKQVKRIKQLISRAENRGYSFAANIIPKRPKRITRQSVERLSKITPDVIYKKATYTDPLSGRTVAGLEGRKIERSRASKKAAYTRQKTRQSMAQKQGIKLGKGSLPSASKIIINNVEQGLGILGWSLSEIANWSPHANWTDSLTKAKRKDKNTISRILKAAIAELTEEEVARRLEQQASEVTELIESILYASGSREGNFKDGRTQVNADINRVTQIILGRPLTVEESIEQTEENEEQEFED